GQQGGGNRARDRRNDVTGEQYDEGTVAQRAPDARNEGVGLPRGELRTFTHLPGKQPVKRRQHYRERHADRGEHLPLVPSKKLHHYARSRRRYDRSENRERLSHPEQARPLVIVEREFGSERVMGERIDGVKDEIERKGEREPQRRPVSRQPLRRTQHRPERKPAHWRPENQIRSPAAQPRARPIG